MILKYIKSKIEWEFWPTWLANIPVGLFWLYFSIRARHLFFFSTVNHQFENGAMMGASKRNILQHIPPQYLPKTIFLKKDELVLKRILEEIKAQDLSFPLIAKPDIGERGLLVELIKSEKELTAYIQANKINFLIQEYITHPNEVGIFYYRNPSQLNGEIVSVALKDFLSVTGDGTNNIKALLEIHQMGRLQIDRLSKVDHTMLLNIPRKGEKILLEPIGNHCRGTRMLNGNHLIDDKLKSTFDQINSSMPDVYYGRFDIKYKSWERLLDGKDFKIIELNGVASEPMHVYDRSIAVVDKYRAFYHLWKKIYEISQVQRAKGIKPISFTEAIGYIRNYFKYIRSINLEWRALIA